VAREAHVKMLALVHISSRYHVGAVLDEARDVFEPCVAPRDFDLIEIPLPERGEPALVPNGARENHKLPVEDDPTEIGGGGRDSEMHPPDAAE
jgi:hypothetical protein